MVLDGEVSGSGGLLKIGGGPLVINSTNSYTGPSDIEIGTLLHLELRNIESGFHLVILASVVRVNARAGCASLVGCNFIRELTHQELKALL